MKLYSKMGNAFFSLTFVGLLILPTTLWITGKGPAPTQTLENRNPAVFPDLKQINLRQLPEALEPWLVDNLPLRTQAVASYLLLWEWHLYTPVRHYFRGKNDSLFVLNLLKTHAGIVQPANAQFYRTRALLKGRQAWFENAGTAYLFMMPPDKETVRAGELPDWIVNAQQQRPWRKFKVLLEKAAIPFIDIVDVLKEEASQNYNRKHDLGHWNSRGLATALAYAWEHLAPKMPIGVKPILEPVNFIEHSQPLGFLGEEIVPLLDMPLIRSVEVVKDGSPVNVAGHPARTIPFLIENPQVGSGVLMIASDSYIQSIQNTFWPPDFRCWPNPLMLQVHKTLSLDRSSLSYPNMVLFSQVIKPDAVLDSTCERELPGPPDREYHPETMLLGEKTLGNLKVPLLPDIAIVQHGNAELQQSPEALSIKATTTDPILILPPVTTTDEGYAVVGGRMVSPAATPAQVFYQAPDGVWKVVSQWINAGENILYFQIVDAPNTTLNIRFDPGQVLGEYTLLPMPFLDLPPKEPQG